MRHSGRTARRLPSADDPWPCTPSAVRVRSRRPRVDRRGRRWRSRIARSEVSDSGPSLAASTARQHRGVQVLSVVGRPFLVGEVERIASAVDGDQTSLNGIASPAGPCRRSLQQRDSRHPPRPVESQHVTVKLEVPGAHALRIGRVRRLVAGSRSSDGASSPLCRGSRSGQRHRAPRPEWQPSPDGTTEAEKAEDLPSQRALGSVDPQSQSSTGPRSERKTGGRVARYRAAQRVGASSGTPQLTSAWRHRPADPMSARSAAAALEAPVPRTT